ncbi:hypothetical protein [Collimonas antrihumi]|uniref:hypothetical protein n=1 Tax=Collimonas antrihumi TaxID=1940615 RepID=UPI001B8B7F5A|nr:hypothetical protein [Collimonas antrihumi]
MNIAFPAVLLFLFLSPGFVFHRFFQAREIRAADLTPFSSTVLMATTVAVVVNALVMYVAICWAGYQFHLGEFLRLFIGGTSAATEVALFPIYRRLNHFPFEPFWFFFATNVMAIIAASFWRFAVCGTCQ